MRVPMAPVHGSPAPDEASTLLTGEASTAEPSTPPVSRSRYLGLAGVATALVVGVKYATVGSTAAMFQAKAAKTSESLDFIAYSGDYGHESAVKTASPLTFVKTNRLVEPVKDTGEAFGWNPRDYTHL